MSLDSLLSDAKNDDLRFVFVGGKGGVGKTTSSSAIASLLARTTGKQILLVSTDPAHSLGDAWRMTFNNLPTCPDKDLLPNLHVMEVNPKDTMDKELNTWAAYAKELQVGESSNNDDTFLNQIAMFHEWLSGIPGIDEATALSSAIAHIESGEFDIIVFDTAPTGHTLKLLALPDTLQHGIDKLQSWQTTLWGYWEAFKGFSGGPSSSSNGDGRKSRAAIKDEVSHKLSEYKRGIQKVARMLQDQVRTRFVVVCIAEFLSVSETQRLLQELVKNQVRASHILVNQLVVHDALSRDELTELEGFAEVGKLALGQVLLQKTIHACRLTTARKNIQHKYLQQLKSMEETAGIRTGICEVPLLPEEVTGTEAITRFSRLLVKDKAALSDSKARDISTTPVTPRVLYEDNDNYSDIQQKMQNTSLGAETPLCRGDVIKIIGLAKAPQFNNTPGRIISNLDTSTSRYGISLMYQGKPKKLALQRKNIQFVRKGAVKEQNAATNKRKLEKNNWNNEHESAQQEQATKKLPENTMSKALGVLEDPEIKEMIKKNPKIKGAVNDVMANPMNFTKYMSNPQLAPFIQKLMEKLQK